ncbi:related to enoyl-CoA hydratase precursor, mitochondrial [Phialocephala subalpina]|uniref:Related to enoyl-CoA hydratase, mitochondrial n=1 Tax=Phialocephala subalpina TaxID=576137 RepID=A0A1L7WZP4_9HELO|nr:related to enoyl-CoA hydratase precursor, mitochondrial [Phialocephala subalpina]
MWSPKSGTLPHQHKQSNIFSRHFKPSGLAPQQTNQYQTNYSDPSYHQTNQIARNSMEFSTDTSLIQVTVDEKGVAVVKINRPEKRNALSQQTIDCLVRAIAMVERDDKVRVVVLTGSRSSGPFSAGADLSELQHLSTVEAHRIQYLKDLSDAITKMRKPIIASVAGFALGGGFELAMMCDILYAADDAKFGLPELSVGTIPGAGGTQRLARIVGKQKAMDMILTSSTMSGKELERLGLVARAFPLDKLYTSTIDAAHKIASKSVPVVQLAKQAILNSEETHMDAGLKYERSLYYSSFSLEDRTEVGFWVGH